MAFIPQPKQSPIPVRKTVTTRYMKWRSSLKRLINLLVAFLHHTKTHLFKFQSMRMKWGSSIYRITKPVCCIQLQHLKRRAIFCQVLKSCKHDWPVEISVLSPREVHDWSLAKLLCQRQDINPIIKEKAPLLSRGHQKPYWE
ncbi:hypothetical protein O6H91_13G074400 [Diphasiastrum complanatum]|uniref:Uncharacterized protein n=1 Tax=Diphasiastrum complanatum TaxID=34168 RepID=A0ACC2BW26_DIPCM|nr:hypothetical protein O6H91_13G074400 [Diphasiastrum complanatum]